MEKQSGELAPMDLLKAAFSIIVIGCLLAFCLKLNGCFKATNNTSQKPVASKNFTVDLNSNDIDRMLDFTPNKQIRTEEAQALAQPIKLFLANEWVDGVYYYKLKPSTDAYNLYNAIISLKLDDENTEYSKRYFGFYCDWLFNNKHNESIPYSDLFDKVCIEFKCEDKQTTDCYAIYNLHKFSKDDYASNIVKVSSPQDVVVSD